jgi:hypothetical protein
MLLFAGPLLESLAIHWNLFTETKVRVRVQALLTQLVFEHSLRIRLKAETSDDANLGQRTVNDLNGEQSATASTATDNTSLGSETGEGSTVHAEPSQSSTLVVSRDESLQGTPEGSLKGKSKDTRTTETLRAPPRKQSGDTQNLMGKINNLVTSDLDNIVEGVNFLSLGEC